MALEVGYAGGKLCSTSHEMLMLKQYNVYISIVSFFFRNATKKLYYIRPK